MSKIFETTMINGMTLANRFVRSATWEGMANMDGSVSPKLTDLMVQLADGGVGLIITGLTYVRKDGHSMPWQLGNYNDVLIPGLTEMANAVHNAGGKIVIQLAHGGVQSSPDLIGMTPLGPYARAVQSVEYEAVCPDLWNVTISA